MNGKQMRSSVRLKAAQHSGLVVLRRLNAPLIMCDLQDISEMGCRCVARVRINDWSDSEKWRTLLSSGELFEAEITFEPYIPFIRIPIEIRSAIALPGNGYELGLAFFDVEAGDKDMLNKAMISIATEKIRHSKGVLKREERIRSDSDIIPLSSSSYPTPSARAHPAILNAEDREIPLPDDSGSPYSDSRATTIMPAVEASEEQIAAAYGPKSYEVPEIPVTLSNPPAPQQDHTMDSSPFVFHPRLSAFVRRPGDTGATRTPPPSLEDDEVIDIPKIPPSAKEKSPHRKLGEVLTRRGQMSRPEIHNAISSARHAGQRLGEYLVREGKLTPLEMLQARSEQVGVPWVDLESSHIKSELLELFPFSKMKRFEFVPFEAEGNIVRVAAGNPLPLKELAELSRISGRTLEQFICHEEVPRKYLKTVEQRFELHRRAHPRFKISLPMSFQCCPPDGPPLSSATFRGRTLDISQGGMQVSGPAILGIEPDKLTDGQLRMMVTIGAVPQDIIGLCETRHVRLMRNGGATSCVYGLKLDQMSEAHRDILQGMLARVNRSQTNFYSDEPSGAHDIPSYS